MAINATIIPNKSWNTYIGEIKPDDDLLGITLRGFQTIIKNRISQIENRVYLQFSKNTRLMVMRHRRLHNSQIYPYVLLNISGIRRISDRVSETAMRRIGMRRFVPNKVNEVEKLGMSLDIVRIFPIQLDMRLIFVDVDAERLLNAAQVLTILSSSRAFSFQVDLSDLVFEVQSVVDPDLVVPENLVNLESEEDYAQQAIELSLHINTYSGFITDFPKNINRQIDYHVNE